MITKSGLVSLFLSNKPFSFLKNPSSLEGPTRGCSITIFSNFLNHKGQRNQARGSDSLETRTRTPPRSCTGTLASRVDAMAPPSQPPRPITHDPESAQKEKMKRWKIYKQLEFLRNKAPDGEHHQTKTTVTTTTDVTYASPPPLAALLQRITST